MQTLTKPNDSDRSKIRVTFLKPLRTLAVDI